MKAILALLTLFVICSARLIYPEADIQADRIRADNNDGFHIEDFLRGLLEGLNEKGDVNDLLKCTQGLEDAVNKVTEAFKLIGKRSFEYILAGIIMLVQAVKEIMNILKPCSDGYAQFKKLVVAMQKTKPIQLVMRVLADLNTYITLIEDFIKTITRQDFQAGKDLGQILDKLYLIE